MRRQTKESLCCHECNRFDPGHSVKYRAAMTARYGQLVEGIVNSKNNLMKLMRYEVEIIRDTYKAKFNEIKKKKGL